MNPCIRVRISVALVSDGRILLFPHRSSESDEILWFLPGGAMEHAESMEAAAKRECEEETGYNIEVGDLLDVSEWISDDKSRHSINIIFVGSITGGELRAENHSTFGELQAQWFSYDEMPDVVEPLRRAVMKAINTPVSS